MRRVGFLGLTLLLALLSACAEKKIPAAPVALAPRFPEYSQPAVPQDLAGTPAAAAYNLGWKYFQAGDFKNAERELGAALKASAAFYPAEAASGYLELARK